MIFESDLFILSKTFLPEGIPVIVIDPRSEVKRNYPGSGLLFPESRDMIEHLASELDDYCLINTTSLLLSQFPFKQERIKAAISFNKSIERLPDMKRALLNYVENPYDTLRWIWTDELKQPSFLEIYDNDAQYTMMFKGLSKFFFAIGQGKWIADKQIQLLKRGDFILEGFENRDFETFSLYAGRFLLSGKINLQLINNKKVTAYAKRGFKKAIIEKTRQECEILRQLNEHSFENLVVPKCSFNGEYQVQSQIEEEGLTRKEELSGVHLKALSELYRLKEDRIQIFQFLEEQKTGANLKIIRQNLESDSFPSGLSAMTSAELLKLLVQCLNQLNVEEEIKLHLAHMDFNPWNMFVDDKKIYLYHWELASWGMPAGWDVMEFIWQLAENDSSDPESAFDKTFNQLKNLPEYSDFEKHLLPEGQLVRLFALVRISRLFSEYSQKKVVPYQLNWKFYFWKRMLQRFNK